VVSRHHIIGFSVFQRTQVSVVVKDLRFEDKVNDKK